MDEDRKSTALKALQDHLARRLSQRLYFTISTDVLPALEKWKAQGIDLYVYSSGSVAAQKLLFGYSDEGDITHLFTGYFDTTVGAKREVQSYRNIAEHTGPCPGTILFLSDIHQELDAAEAAGLRTVQLVRGDRDPASHHPQVQRLTTFIRSRSQHERINSFSVTDPQTPVWHSTDAKAIQDQLNAKGVRFSAGRPTATSAQIPARKR